MTTFQNYEQWNSKYDQIEDWKETVNWKKENTAIS